MSGATVTKLKPKIGQLEIVTLTPALKSTAPWWRASVQMDKRKKRQTAIESLQNQARSLMEAPLEKLDSIVNDMLATFIAELQKP